MPIYQETLDYLYSFLDTERKLPRRPAELNLPRTAALLDMFGAPQQAFPTIVIAGTKGKGSTAAMTAAILTAAGYRTGLYHSPHLDRVEERLIIDGRPCPAEEFAALVEYVRPIAEAMDSLRSPASGRSRVSARTIAPDATASGKCA